MLLKRRSGARSWASLGAHVPGGRPHRLPVAEQPLARSERFLMRIA